VLGQTASLPVICSPAVVMLVEHQAWPAVTPVTLRSVHWLYTTPRCLKGNMQAVPVMAVQDGEVMDSVGQEES